MSDRGGTRRGPGRFERFSSALSERTGHPAAALLATSGVLAWAVLGPVFGFSDTWQLVVNTSTTILTFLMVFVIQSSLNRGNKALHLKLDELIRASDRARDAIIGAQDLSEAEIDLLDEQEPRADPPDAPEPSSPGASEQG